MASAAFRVEATIIEELVDLLDIHDDALSQSVIQVGQECLKLTDVVANVIDTSPNNASAFHGNTQRFFKLHVVDLVIIKINGLTTTKSYGLGDIWSNCFLNVLL